MEEPTPYLEAAIREVVPRQPEELQVLADKNNSCWMKFLALVEHLSPFSELEELNGLLDDDDDDSGNNERDEVMNAAATENDRWWRRVFSLVRRSVTECNKVVNVAAASNDRWWRRVFPLGRHCSMTDKAFGACMATIASAMVTAVLTLNVYSATYFLAWARESSNCFVGSTSGLAPTAALGPTASLGPTSSLPDAFKIWLKVIAVGLPFLFVPITSCVSGMAKAADKSHSGLGFVAGIILGEFTYVIILGGLMTMCMSNASYVIVLPVTIRLIVGFICIWGCVFNYPKCLRRCVYPSCCPKYDLQG